MEELQHFTWYCWLFAGYSVFLILGLLVYGAKFIINEIKSH